MSPLFSFQTVCANNQSTMVDGQPTQSEPPTPDLNIDVVKRKKKIRKKPGPPTIMTPQVIGKLEEAFGWGCTDIEACAWANIHVQTLYKYQDKNPSFVYRKEALKATPDIFAQRTLSDSLTNGDKDTARWWLERKKKDIFSIRNEHTGKDGKDLLPKPILGGQSNMELDVDDVPGDDRDQEAA